MYHLAVPYATGSQQPSRFLYQGDKRVHIKSKAVNLAARNYPVLVRSVHLPEGDGTYGNFRGQLEEKSSGHGIFPTVRLQDN